jgi:hypothetical protein
MVKTFEAAVLGWSIRCSELVASAIYRILVHFLGHSAFIVDTLSPDIISSLNKSPFYLEVSYGEFLQKLAFSHAAMVI